MNDINYDKGIKSLTDISLSSSFEIGNVDTSNISKASVEHRQVGYRHFLDFIIPKGEKGQRGIKGAKGDSLIFLPILDNIIISYPLKDYLGNINCLNTYFEKIDLKRGSNILVPYGGVLKSIKFKTNAENHFGIVISKTNKNNDLKIITNELVSTAEYSYSKPIKISSYCNLNIMIFASSSLSINGGLLIKI